MQREEQAGPEGGFGGKTITNTDQTVIRVRVSHASGSGEPSELKGMGQGTWGRAAKDLADRVLKWVERDQPTPPHKRGKDMPPSTVMTLPGRIGRVSPEQRGDEARDVFRRPPPVLRHEPFLDAAIVDVLHVGRHVGLDDPRPNFIDGNAVAREADREQTRRHREARLADAVVAARLVDRRHLRRHRGDEHDRRRERRLLAALRFT